MSPQDLNRAYWRLLALGYLAASTLALVAQPSSALPTRGKTASNRLRRVDNFILLYEPSLLTRTDGLFAPDLPLNRTEISGVADSLFVDLGYGFDARTTLESAGRFRRVNPNLPILGVEIDKERVDAAIPYADEVTHFRLGGFNLPLQAGESVRLILSLIHISEPTRPY